MRRSPADRAAKAQEKADRQLARMAPLRDAMAGFSSSFWKFVSDRLEQRMKSLRWARSIENVAKISNPAEAGLRLATILAQEEAIEGVISLPVEVAAVLKMMEEEYRKTCAVTGDDSALDKNKL